MDNQLIDTSTREEQREFVFNAEDDSLANRLSAILNASWDQLQESAEAIKLTADDQKKLLKAYSELRKDADKDAYIQSVVTNLPAEISPSEIKQASVEIQTYLLKRVEKEWEYEKTHENFTNRRYALRLEMNEFKTQASAQPNLMANPTFAQDLQNKISEFKVKLKDFAKEEEILDAKLKELGGIKVNSPDKQQVVTLWSKALSHAKMVNRPDSRDKSASLGIIDTPRRQDRPKSLLTRDAQQVAPSFKQIPSKRPMVQSDATTVAKADLTRRSVDLSTILKNPNVTANKAATGIAEIAAHLEQFSAEQNKRRENRKLQGLSELATTLKDFQAWDSQQRDPQNFQPPQETESATTKADISPKSPTFKPMNGSVPKDYEQRALDKLNKEYDELDDQQARDQFTATFKERYKRLKEEEKQKTPLSILEPSQEQKSSNLEPSPAFRKVFSKIWSEATGSPPKRPAMVEMFNVYCKAHGTQGTTVTKLREFLETNKTFQELVNSAKENQSNKNEGKQTDNVPAY